MAVAARALRRGAPLSPVTATASTLSLATLAVGSRGAVRKRVAAADVAAFAALLGDDNEIHHADFRGAPGALFGGRPVAHGMLSAGLIATVFGRQIPGSVYVAQALRFRRPVFLGDEVEASVVVTALARRGARTLCTCATTVVRVGGESDAGLGEVVIDGEATVLLPQAAEPPTAEARDFARAHALEAPEPG